MDAAWSVCLVEYVGRGHQWDIRMDEYDCKCLVSGKNLAPYSYSRRRMTDGYRNLTVTNASCAFVRGVPLFLCDLPLFEFSTCYMLLGTSMYGGCMADGDTSTKILKDGAKTHVIHRDRQEFEMWKLS